MVFELGVRAACEDDVGVARVDASMRARGVAMSASTVAE